MAVGACALSAAVWLASYAIGLHFEVGFVGGSIGLGTGELLVDGFSQPLMNAPWDPPIALARLGNTAAQMTWRELLPWRSVRKALYGGRGVRVPLWYAPASLAVASIVLHTRRSPAELAGHCPMCGYDLTGNVSGRCPECGVVAADRPRERV